MRNTYLMETPGTNQQAWTILGIVERSAIHFEEKGIDSPRLTSELLLCHALGVQRIELYTKFDTVLSPHQLSVYRGLVKRRIAREPLQYIVGFTEFMGLEIIVDQRVLIPRPETELLVEEVIRRSAGRSAPRILDIGTGSGCIAIALAKMIPGCSVSAIDKSDEALAVAALNVQHHDVAKQVHLASHDFLTSPRVEGSPFDIVVSNPPYVSRTEWAELQPEVREFEPRCATTDDGDGLSFYTSITEKARQLLAPGGVVCMELGHGQADAVKKLFQNQGFASVQTSFDYERIERILTAEWRAG